MQSLRLEGSIKDRLSSTGAPAVLIEAWDAEEKSPEVLATALSNNAGDFALLFDDALVQKAFAGRPQKVSLKLFMKGARLAFSPAEEIILTEIKKPLALTINIPQPYAGDNLFMHIPADLRPELDSLKKHSPTVLKRLKDEKTRQAFLENPAQSLAAMGVPISAQLRQRLMSQLPPTNLLTAPAFRLLNGQVVTPKVNIRFTEGKEEPHGR